MLYDRWREMAREFRDELALLDAASGQRWRFADLERAAENACDTGVAFPSGPGAEFVLAVLAAWRGGRIVCPLEPGQKPPLFPLPPPRIAHLKLTSATTGAPKLVALTAEQLAADAENIVATMGLRRDWPNLAFISMAHSYGFSNLITPLLLHGIPLILGGAPLPEVVRSVAQEFEAVTIAAVPALWRTWHDADAIPPNVRLAISAGAPLPLALESEVLARRGLKIHNFYGSSECGGIAYDASNSARRDAGCVGTAMRNVSLRINAGGCLEVRGANVAETYWPDAAATLGGGCFRTSDLAELRDQAVFLRGRASDVIHVAGRKVAPETIEAALQQHSAVRECLVFGAPSADVQRGDTIVACVVAAQGASIESMRQFLLERVDAWQVPRDFWFVESLEANHRGKLSRSQWRERYLQRAK